MKPIPDNFAVIHNFSPALFSCFSDSNEIAVVIRQRIEHVKDLPEPIMRTKISSLYHKSVYV